MVHLLPRPVKLSQEAVVRPSRKLLILLGVIFLISLFFMNDIWSGPEADMLAHLYLIEGLPTAGAAKVGLITLLVTKTFTTLTKLVHLPLWVGFRLSALFFLVTTILTMYAAAKTFITHPYFWPIRFPFGGEAKPRAYQKSFGMVAVFLLLATFGWIVHRLESTADMGVLAVGTLFLYGLVSLPTRQATYLLGFAIALGNLTAITTLGASLMGITALILVQAPSRIQKVFFIAAFTSLLFFLTLVLAGGWHIACVWSDMWLHQWGVSLSPLVWLLKNSIWYLCPLWPGVFAMLYIWRWHIGERPLRMPLLYIVLLIVGMGLLWGTIDPNLSALLLLPPLTLMAALAVVSIKAGKRHLLDWFGITIPTLAMLVLWLYWGAWVLEWPIKMAKTVSRLAPEAVPVVGIEVGIMALFFILWLVMVAWRLTHRPTEVWYGAWVTCCGLALTVMTALAIYQPAIEANRSYAPIAHAIDLHLRTEPQSHQCLDVSGVPARQRALLLEAVPHLPMHMDMSCTHRLIRTRTSEAPQPGALGPYQRPHTEESFWLIHQH